MTIVNSLGQFVVELGSVCASAIGAVLMIPLMVRAHRWDKNHFFVSPQNIHVEPTSRLGGAAVFLAYGMAVAVALKLGHISPRAALPLLISSLPVLVVGLWEDIARRVPPTHRLIAATVSAALASLLSQSVITRLDLPEVDSWLAYLPFALPLTWFMVAGACNAINIIDGTNGLAGGTALLMFVGIAVVARDSGDTLILAQATGMVGALLGFLLWNYPRGKIFLGDAGAYFIGFIYAQLSIQLVARHPGISAWFVIALAAYPIVETLFSMYRRKIDCRTATMQPDALHLHSLLYLRFLSFADHYGIGDRRLRTITGTYSSSERRKPERRANAKVAPWLWLHVAICLATALAFYDNTPLLVGFTIAYAIYYMYCYRKATRLSAERAPLFAPSPKGP